MGAMLTITRLLATGLLLAAAAAPGHEGRWDVEIDRTGWQPPVARGRLALAKDGKSWSGTITFQVLMNGRRLTLEDVAVKGKELSFKIPGLDYELDGKLKKGALSGTCQTANGQRFEWTGARHTTEPAELFEKGLRAAKDLPRGDAKKLGVSMDDLNDLVHAAEKADTDALLVIVGGKTVCERTFGGELEPIPIMSVTKGVTALAVAALIEDGKIDSLDQHVSVWFDDWGEGVKSTVTLRHLVTHTSGLRHAKLAHALNNADDRVAYARAAPLSDPGKEWSYNNDATALLSGIVEAAAGKPLDEYVQERLFDRMGIEKPRWNRDEAGHTVSYAELFLDMRDLARIGQLLANDGAVGKEAVLEKKTIELLTGQVTPLSDGQGVLWFRVFDDDKNAIGVRHDGWLGQHLVVLPESDVVAVRLRHGKQGDGQAYGLGDFTARVVALSGR